MATPNKRLFFTILLLLLLAFAAVWAVDVDDNSTSESEQGSATNDNESNESQPTKLPWGFKPGSYNDADKPKKCDCGGTFVERARGAFRGCSEYFKTKCCGALSKTKDGKWIKRASQFSPSNTHIRKSTTVNLISDQSSQDEKASHTPKASTSPSLHCSPTLNLQKKSPSAKQSECEVVEFIMLDGDEDTKPKQERKDTKLEPRQPCLPNQEQMRALVRVCRNWHSRKTRAGNDPYSWIVDHNQGGHVYIRRRGGWTPSGFVNPDVVKFRYDCSIPSCRASLFVVMDTETGDIYEVRFETKVNGKAVVMETIQDSHNHPAPQAGNVASDTMKSERIHKIMNGSETASSLLKKEKQLSPEERAKHGMFSDSQAYGYQTRYGPKIDELEKMKEVAGEFYLGMSEEIVFDEKKDMKPFRNLQIYLVARQTTLNYVSLFANNVATATDTTYGTVSGCGGVLLLTLSYISPTDGKVRPYFAAIISGASADDFRRAFQAAKRQGINLHFLVADGEQAIWCAAREVWPDCEIRFCQMHLRQTFKLNFHRNVITPSEEDEAEFARHIQFLTCSARSGMELQEYYDLHFVPFLLRFPALKAYFDTFKSLYPIFSWSEAFARDSPLAQDGTRTTGGEEAIHSSLKAELVRSSNLITVIVAVVALLRISQNVDEYKLHHALDYAQGLQNDPVTPSRHRRAVPYAAQTRFAQRQQDGHADAIASRAQYPPGIQISLPSLLDRLAQSKKPGVVTYTESQLEELVRQLGLDLVNVPGDTGDCFFYAVSAVLQGQHSHTALRRMAAQFLRDNHNLKINGKPWHEVFGVEPVAYVNSLQNGAWAEMPAVWALSQILNVQFVVTMGTTSETVAPLSGQPSQTYLLGLLQQHYYATLPAGTTRPPIPTLSPDLTDTQKKNYVTSTLARRSPLDPSVRGRPSALTSAATELSSRIPEPKPPKPVDPNIKKLVEPDRIYSRAKNVPHPPSRLAPLLRFVHTDDISISAEIDLTCVGFAKGSLEVETFRDANFFVRFGGVDDLFLHDTTIVRTQYTPDRTCCRLLLFNMLALIADHSYKFFVRVTFKSGTVFETEVTFDSWEKGVVEAPPPPALAAPSAVAPVPQLSAPSSSQPASQPTAVPSSQANSQAKKSQSRVFSQISQGGSTLGTRPSSVRAIPPALLQAMTEELENSSEEERNNEARKKQKKNK